MAHIRKVFDTNTFGVMAMCQAVIPQMRQRRAGVIVNVTSSVTLASYPLAAPYKASKQAITGFSESLARELAYFDIQLKIVEPGYAPTTRFTQNTALNPLDLIPEAYEGFAAPIFAKFGEPQLTTQESDVAQAVWEAVHDTGGKLHFPAGADALHLANGGQLDG
jgi:NAD(P)-dependent dehydrogenase (short-subunit alcohol dehydrogenase family)